MNIKRIIELTESVCVAGDVEQVGEITFGFACDLMSDVLILDTNKLLLITGLCNIQTIRTAEMADLKCILVVRNKTITPDMIALAEENGLVLLQSPYSMFRAVAALAKEGIEPIF
ncbi:MAG: hypothetical protein SOZ00_01890 [Tidjanibacter sp.]|nr:hypothetical protein [Tidjanibacter sp.]